MDKTAIKNYAVAARRKLVDAIRQKAFQLYIFEDGALPLDEAYRRLRADGIFLTPKQSEARLRLCNELAALGHNLDNKAAYQHVVEEVAYTWFNRLIALRFMEVNEYLPSGIRILSSRDGGRVEPDAMREAEHLDYVDQAKIAEFRSDTGINASEKLYKYILISQCNALSAILPGMFQKLGDYTELLLPDALYTKGGIVHDLVNAITEEDFRDQVQITGWLYQYYISEKKDEVFAALKKNIKISKETIPAATQLFTPEWIVKYMVENSLGRTVINNLKYEIWAQEEKAKIDILKSKWKYYVDDTPQSDEVEAELRALEHNKYAKGDTSFESATFIDPCMGSGHILVYAFDVFYQIYSMQGYAERDIPNLILAHNIYGLDIDDRAGQLAYFALMMKARSYNRRFFRQDNIPQPMVYAIPETVPAYFAESDAVFGAHMTDAEKRACHEDLMYLVTLFESGKEYGSVMKIEREIDYIRLKTYIHDQTSGQMTMDMEEVLERIGLLDRVIDVAAMLSRKYDVVVTNPPYMAPTSAQAGFIKKHYPESKSDLGAVFIEICNKMLNKYGLQAMITMHSWMFLSSFERLRARILSSSTIVNLVHVGYNSFPEMNSKVAQAATFVLKKTQLSGFATSYLDLTNNYGQSFDKETAFFIETRNVYSVISEKFREITGCPFAYWAKEATFTCFSMFASLKNYVDARSGISTGDNDTYYRFWYECDTTKICYDPSYTPDNSNLKWFPIIRGGDFRKWYGNMDNVIDLEDGCSNIKKSGNNFRLRTPSFYNKHGITWNRITSSNVSFRVKTEQVNFGENSPCMFVDKACLSQFMGFLNSNTAMHFLKFINPTLTFQVVDIQNLPYKEGNVKRVDILVHENISISRTDWDSLETSWDFITHPLIAFKGNYEEATPLLYADDLVEGMIVTKWNKASPPIEQAYDAWERFTYEQFDKLKANEEELNRIFIDIYGLQDELTPEVDDKDVTIRRAELGRDIRSFLSYAVGCMFGRYSLDEEGLVYAGGQFDMNRYKTFLPEEDNIIPIGSADYFDDDIVVRFTEFVRAVYGDDTLNENLNFIADTLYPTGGGSAKDKIRRYFLNDFYKDHVRIYQKRPIYWLLDSGKKDGFKALIYLHRYDKYTIARARTDYLHPLQRKYDAEMKRLEMLAGSADNAREKAAYRKEIETLQGKAEECRVYDQVVSHIAHQQIELDLDDGVVVNYAKFQDVEVPKDNGKTVEMDLLARV